MPTYLNVELKQSELSMERPDLELVIQVHIAMIQLNWLLLGMLSILGMLSMLIIQGVYISHKSNNTALQLK